MLLKQWPQVTPEVALQLLDCSFTDLRVRQFAVHCLETGISDDKLQRYLLQFVQVSAVHITQVLASVFIILLQYNIFRCCFLAVKSALTLSVPLLVYSSIISGICLFCRH